MSALVLYISTVRFEQPDILEKLAYVKMIGHLINININ